jgi:hypothetical protein
MKYLLALSLLTVITESCNNTKNIKQKGEKTIIEIQFPFTLTHQDPANIVFKDYMELRYSPIIHEENNEEWQSLTTRLTEGKARWLIYSDQILQVNYGFGNLRIVNPGDSIHIIYDGRESVFSGKGADKLNIWNQTIAAEKALATPPDRSIKISSLEEYLKWNQYLDQKIALQLPVLDSSKNKIKPSEYQYLKKLVIKPTLKTLAAIS